MTVVFTSKEPKKKKMPKRYLHEARPVDEGAWTSMDRSYRFKWLAVLDAQLLASSGYMVYRVVDTWNQT